MTIAIGDFPTITITGTTTLILGDGDGSQMPLSSVLSYGLEHLSVGTSIAGTDSVVAVIGGVAELIPVFDLISSGLPDSAPLIGTNSEGQAVTITPDSNWFTMNAGAITINAFPASTPLIGFAGGRPSAVALGSGLSITSGTINLGAVTTTNWALTDGTTTVSSVETLTVVNGEVSSAGTGSTAATLTIPVYEAGANITITGSDNVIAFNPEGLPIPFSIFSGGGTLTGSQIIWSAKFPYDLAADLALDGWQFESLVGTATSSATITFTIGGTAAAIATFGAGSSTATVTNLGTAALAISASSRMQLVGPATADATMAGIEATLLFTRAA